MKSFETAQIRNVALVGHSGAGKTSLAEALLYAQKVTERLGRVDDGTTVADYDPEEIRRRHSINAALIPIEAGPCKINLLDLPGRRDFVGEAKGCLRVADATLFVVDAVAGVEVGTEFFREYADELGVGPRAVFVNKMEKEEASFRRVVDQAGETFGRRAVPLTLPAGEGPSFRGVVDLIRLKVVEEDDRKTSYADLPAELAEAARAARAQLVEASAEGDDELTEKFLEDQPLTEEEIGRGLRGAIAQGRLLPVLAGSAALLKGLAPLLDLIREGFPDPTAGTALTLKHLETGEIETIQAAPDGPALIYVFKTVTDPYTGHLSFFKVMRGSLQSEASLANLNAGKSERLAHLLHVCGKKFENVASLPAGDLGAVAKLDHTRTGDTLSADAQSRLAAVPAPLPKPTVRMAVKPKSKADEEKIGLAFRKLIDADPTLHLARDPEVRQTILTGMGDGHLDVAVARLKEIAKVEVELVFPKVPYRETITRTAQGQGKYKKQSGGRGQYGDCWIRFEPLGGDSEFEFEWGIVGGVIPTKYQPSVEKGLIEAMEHGVLSGHRTVGLKAVCYDGSHHSVDSSELAFKVAASLAFKNVLPNAGPVILEPIYLVTVTIPETYMGDVMGDLNGRRGRILGMEAAGKKQLIKAQVPLAEMFTYSRDLRSMTRGSGVYEMDFDHYERVPAELQEKIIAQSQVAAETT